MKFSTLTPRYVAQRRAMLHSAEVQTRTMLHSEELRLRTMLHIAESPYIREKLREIETKYKKKFLGY
jgi:hypothetical protein